MVTSAINTKFGVYTSSQRLYQTIATVDSIKERVPDAKIVVVEMAAIPLRDDQIEALEAKSDLLINFNNDEDVQAIFVSDNWDVVKNTTEVMCFSRALQQCLDNGEFDDVDRVHKISGRYRLNDNFTLQRYEDNPTRLIVTHKHQSQFPIALTGVEYQYMSRLWSWPASATASVIDAYDEGLDYMAERLAAGGYCDIEHMLYKFLPADLILEASPVGLEGNIGPNGAAVND
jgi:hypothetical protein